MHVQLCEMHEPAGLENPEDRDHPTPSTPDDAIFHIQWKGTAGKKTSGWLDIN